MAVWLSTLFRFVVPDPDSTTRRDGRRVHAAVARLPHRWTVTRRVDRAAAKGMARRHLVVEMHGAVAMPAFRLDRHGGEVVLSEHGDTGAWTLGRFAGVDPALAALRRAALARFAGVGAAAVDTTSGPWCGGRPGEGTASLRPPQAPRARGDGRDPSPIADAPPAQRAYHRPPPALRLRPARAVEPS